MSHQEHEPAYLKEVREAGLNVTPYEARRFRAMLTNFSCFKAYMLRKLAPLDMEWMRSIAIGSIKHAEETADEDVSEDAVMRHAAKQLLDILQAKDMPETDQAEKTSLWLLDWAAEEGIVKLRSAVNSQVSNQRRRRSPIAVLQSTRDRFNKTLAHAGARTADEMLNDMIDAYEALHGR